MNTAEQSNHILSPLHSTEAYCGKQVGSGCCIDPFDYVVAVAECRLSGPEARACVLAYATCIPCIKGFLKAIKWYLYFGNEHDHESQDRG